MQIKNLVILGGSGRGGHSIYSCEVAQKISCIGLPDKFEIRRRSSMSIHESNRAFKIELPETRTFRFQGTLWRVLATGTETEGIVGALDERLSHGLAAPMHSHEDADEIFYVLGGDLTFFVGDRRIEATEGAFVYLPRYVHHGFQVNSAEARVFNFVTPAGFERLIVDQGKAAKFDDLPIAKVPGPQAQPSKDALERLRKQYSLRYFTDGER